MQKALKCETLLFSHLRAYNFYSIISFMILIIVNIFFYASFLDDLFPFFAIAIYIRHIHHPETSYLEALRHRRFYLRFLFFHPDYTVGFGIAPNHAPCARGLYRRSGITPCPEDIVILLSFIICIAL